MNNFAFYYTAVAVSYLGFFASSTWNIYHNPSPWTYIFSTIVFIIISFVLTGIQPPVDTITEIIKDKFKEDVGTDVKH